MDKFFKGIKRHYKRMKKELIPSKTNCPDEQVIWDYVKGALKGGEADQLEGHLLACDVCSDTLKTIRMLCKAEESTKEVPEYLHKKARHILRKEVEAESAKRDIPVLARISLLWDKVCEKLTQIRPDFGEVFFVPQDALQPVRKIKKVTETVSQGLNNKLRIKINQGTLYLDIDPSTKDGYLSCRISFMPDSDITIEKMENLQIVIYKSNRIYFSVYFNSKGEALLNRIREGEYSLNIIDGERSLGIIELTLLRAR